MPNFYTYSFEDTSLVIQHPDLGSYSAFGTGIGTIAISYANDMTSHEVAADLAVVVSKSAKKNGLVTLEILQSSDFNSWLKKFANYVASAPASRFALATIIVNNKSTGDSFVCTGVSPQKIADANYQSQSQNRSWPLMAANIEMS